MFDCRFTFEEYNTILTALYMARFKSRTIDNDEQQSQLIEDAIKAVHNAKLTRD